MRTDLTGAADERPFKSLSLRFPHGVTAAQCDYIARRVQHIVGAAVSEGGYVPRGDFGVWVEDVQFHDDAMAYTFGHARDQP